MVINKLIEDIKVKKSPIVVGLDPRLESLPQEIIDTLPEQVTMKDLADAVLTFNKGIVDAVYDLVPAVKPQVAFYEQLGLEGMRVYQETCDYAKEKGLFVLGDIKRGDIGSTSKAYSKGHIGKTEFMGVEFKAFEVDSITINPYLGDDCLKEFIDDIKTNDKSMFVLVKTSNPTSKQLQDLKVDGEEIYKKVGDMVEEWSQQLKGNYGYSPVGAVVGATYPEELKTLRDRMPATYFLVPGYGAQGGGAKDVINAFDDNGLGALINSSRGIIFAYKKKDLPYKEAAREAVLEMREDINTELEKLNKKYW